MLKLSHSEIRYGGSWAMPHIETSSLQGRCELFKRIDVDRCGLIVEIYLSNIL